MALGVPAYAWPPVAMHILAVVGCGPLALTLVAHGGLLGARPRGRWSAVACASKRTPMAPCASRPCVPGAFLAVCGHVNIDVILQVERLPVAGESMPVRDRRRVWGGTGANIARQAASLGVPTRLWSRVGADFPDDWRGALEADGVDLAFLDVDVGALTPTCTILTTQDHEQAFCMDQGPMGTMQEHPPDPALVEGLEGWLHVATGDPRAYQGIAEAARNAGVPVALDPGQELRFQYDGRSFERLLEKADAFFVNHHELDVALRLLGYGDPIQILDHTDLVVVTRGKDGADLYRPRKKTLRQPAFPVAHALDPTGAGDALRGGWYAALREGKDVETALRWGQAAAAVAVQHAGSQERVVKPADLRERVPEALV